MILLLMILTPGIPEYLTGSTKFTVLFLNPFAFLLSAAFNIGLYTSGALMIREFAIKYQKGYASILLLGCAYGIMEEGIAVHTFFLASGSPVGDVLESYLRYAGVNWVWAVEITAFHTVFSIALPILLLSLAYPQYSKDRLLTSRSSKLVILIYLLDVIIIDMVASSKPSFLYDLLFVAIVVVLIVFARRISPLAISSKGDQRRHPRKTLLAGLGVFPAYVMYAIIIPGLTLNMPLSPFVDIILSITTYLTLLRYATHNLCGGDNARLIFNLCVGLLIPLFLWAEILEISEVVPAITVVVIVAILMLRRLSQKLSDPDNPYVHGLSQLESPPV